MASTYFEPPGQLIPFFVEKFWKRNIFGTGTPDFLQETLAHSGVPDPAHWCAVPV